MGAPSFALSPMVSSFAQDRVAAAVSNGASVQSLQDAFKELDIAIPTFDGVETPEQLISTAAEHLTQHFAALHDDATSELQRSYARVVAAETAADLITSSASESYRRTTLDRFLRRIKARWGRRSALGRPPPPFRPEVSVCGERLR